MRKTKLLLILMVFSICSCYNGMKKTNTSDSKTKASKDIPKKLLPFDYVKWIEDEINGLKISQIQGNFVYQLQYQPIPYIVALQEKNNSLDFDKLKKESQKREGLIYLSLRLSTLQNNPFLSDEKFEIDNKDIYLLSGMQKDLMLLDGKDTLRCVLFHFNSSRGFLPYDECLMGFEEPKSIDNDITFIFKTDKYLPGKVKIILRKKDLILLPQLKTNKL